MAFTRCNLQDLQDSQIGSVAEELGLPHLAAFLTSIGRAEATLADGILRSYLRDLIRRGWFEILSPNTGRKLRSGCSLVLVEAKLFSVVFSFPEEPALFLVVGDLSQGFPFCAAMLTAHGLLLELAATPWGLSDRQLTSFSDVIEATGWAPGPAAGVVNLVLGHPNFAHHAWNQLSALDEMASGDLPQGIRMVATHQPIGPIHEIFPELIHWPLLSTPVAGLQSLNAPGALFVPVGGRRIKASLVSRLLRFAETRSSPPCRAIRAALSSVEGPVLWISVRTRNRTATNQHAVLTRLGDSFLRAVPNGAIIIDGFSLADDHAKQAPYYGFPDHLGVVDEDRVAAEALQRALGGGSPNKRIHVIAGLSISDSILLSQQADIYFCHHGTLQHKIGWFGAVPGVVHCNRAVLMSRPAAWVTAQSEVAMPPLYLSLDLVQDADAEAEADTETAQLLHWENYTITDIPAVIDTFFSHAGKAKVLIAPAGGE